MPLLQRPSSPTPRTSSLNGTRGCPISRGLSTLENNIQYLCTVDSTRGIRCQPTPGVPGHTQECGSVVSYLQSTWRATIQDLLIVRQIFNDTFQGSYDYYDLLELVFGLFMAVYCQCVIHRLAETYEDWQKLHRTIRRASENRLTGEQMQTAVLRSMNWDCTE